MTSIYLVIFRQISTFVSLAAHHAARNSGHGPDAEEVVHVSRLVDVPEPLFIAGCIRKLVRELDFLHRGFSLEPLSGKKHFRDLGVGHVLHAPGLPLLPGQAKGFNGLLERLAGRAASHPILLTS